MGGAGELLGKIMDELTSLPNTSDVGARPAFLAEFECAQLAANIDMAGPAVVFFQRLLCELSGRHDTAGPDFLQRVARSRSIGVDRAQVFEDLSRELLTLDPDVRRSVFAPTTRQSGCLLNSRRQRGGDRRTRLEIHTRPLFQTRRNRGSFR